MYKHHPLPGGNLKASNPRCHCRLPATLPNEVTCHISSSYRRHISRAEAVRKFVAAAVKKPAYTAISRL